jgi:hypothetical protein
MRTIGGGITTRRILIGVAIASVALAYAARWRRYKGMAAYHLGKAKEAGWSTPQPNGTLYFLAPGEGVMRHLQLADRYDRAAPFPWVIVAPD